MSSEESPRARACMIVSCSAAASPRGRAPSRLLRLHRPFLSASITHAVSPSAATTFVETLWETATRPETRKSAAMTTSTTSPKSTSGTKTATPAAGRAMSRRLMGTSGLGVGWSRDRRPSEIDGRAPSREGPTSLSHSFNYDTGIAGITNRAMMIRSVGVPWCFWRVCWKGWGPTRCPPLRTQATCGIWSG